MATETKYDRNVSAVVAAITTVRDDLGDSVVIDSDTELWSRDGGTGSDLGLDSLQMLEVIFELEDSLGLSLLDGIGESRMITVGDIATAITSAKGQ